MEMHKYVVNGVQHIANDRNPQIPEALAPVIAGIASLHDFFPKPQSVYGNYVKKDLKTGKFSVLGPAHPDLKGGTTLGSAERLHSKNGPGPQLTYTPSGDTYPREEMTPYDFATVYNILPSWNAKVLGTGVNIAISGVSDIAASDVTDFRKTFGLSQYAGTFKTVVNGTDPGADGGGGQGENTLDVEMAGATAPNANVIMVVSKGTSTTGGDELSDEYIIDKEVAPIMTASYGECELGLGAAGNAAINKIWQQGATEGISIFESSGDQGSAGCSNSDQAGPNADQVGLQVNGIASSPYLTAVGGTDFTWSFVKGGPGLYWNTTNGTYGQNAKGYMPEVPWNSTCTNPLVYPIFSNGFTGPESLCNGLIGTDYDGLIVITGGSGGESHCTTGGTTNASCTGGWPKPSWQTGLGVPSDGHRDLPDVSLFASAGFADGVVGSAILDCEASSGSPEKTCDYTNPDYIIYQEIGGTSASSPLMAGVMALVLQKTGKAQGLANPEFYKLYANQVAAGTACDSSTVTNASKCVFNDISSGTNAQVCYAGGPNCVTKTSGDELGILSGYAATKGYDEAIGLGSVNVYNLVNAWPTGTTTPTMTVAVSPSSLAFPSTAEGKVSAAQVVTVKNTGTAAVTLTSATFVGTNIKSFVISAKTCGTSLAVGASCTYSVEFAPATTGALSASLSIADNATGSPQAVTLTGTATVATATLTVAVSPASLTFPSTAEGKVSAAQVVTVKNTGTAAVTLTSATFVGTNIKSFVISAKTCGTSLAVGASCTYSVEFTPALTGALSASLSIADNATGSPQLVALKGTATTATAGPTVTLSPASIAFPVTIVGSTSDAQVVTLTNTGTVAVAVSSIAVSGASYLDLSNCGASLAVKAACSIYVAFKPTAAGAQSGTLVVTDTAAGSPQKIALTGNGAAVPSVKLSTTSIAFPATVHGTTSSAVAVTLTNGGAATLNLTSIAVTGTNPLAFEALDTCGATLAAGANCTVYVAFKPAAAAAYKATLSIADNGGASPQSVALSGTGK